MRTAMEFDDFIRAIHLEPSDERLLECLFRFLSARIPDEGTEEAEAVRMAVEVDRALRWMDRHRPYAYARYVLKQHESLLFTDRLEKID